MVGGWGPWPLSCASFAISTVWSSSLSSSRPQQYRKKSIVSAEFALQFTEKGLRRCQVATNKILHCCFFDGYFYFISSSHIRSVLFAPSLQPHLSFLPNTPSLRSTSTNFPQHLVIFSILLNLPFLSPYSILLILSTSIQNLN